MLPTDAGSLLLPLARFSIEQALGQRSPYKPSMQEWLLAHGACFVTLHKQQELRGCIGTLEAHRPLIEDVKHNALGAAFRDPRFPSLHREELPEISVEVSVLSVPERLTFAHEIDALSQFRPHIDGIIFQWHGYRSTFLPQVWESLPNAQEFLAHLKRKAGLSTDFWAPDVNLFRYTVSKFSE